MTLKDRLNVDIIGPHVADIPWLSTIIERAEFHGIVDGARNCTPDRFLEEGDIVQFGDHQFHVLHCPGHAPGHIVFVNKAARVAHLGDVMLSGSLGRADLPFGDQTALIRSVKEKLLPLGDFYMWPRSRE